MPDRMRRVWAPIDTGVLDMAGGANVFVYVNALVDAALDRDIRQFTVTRVIASIYASPGIEDDPVYFMHGMRIENANVALGSITPEDDTADWILHGTVWASGGVAQWAEANTVHIDNRSQRKSQGEQAQLRWYITNVGANSGLIAIQGRALLLLP